MTEYSIRPFASAEAIRHIGEGLLASELGQRSWPLSFYSRELLFSAAARLSWTEPDIAAI